MDHDDLLVHDADGVRTLTFNRPGSANAFNDHLYRVTAAALGDAGDDAGVRAVVLTGAGRTFCAGTDLVEMAAMVQGLNGAPGPAPDAAPESGGHPFAEFIDRLSGFDKPLIAAVNGAGVGLGLTLLLHCDLVLMAEEARLKVPFSAMGVAPEAASSYLLAQRVGRQRAALALFTSDWISAAQAVEWGLALAVVPDGRVVAEAQDLAARIAAHPLASLSAIKRLLREPERAGIGAARAMEDEAFARLLRQPGAHEGVAAQLGGTP